MITIPEKHKDVGNVEIQDDDDELTIYVGNYTHWHAACYEDDLEDEQKAESIVEDVAEFLRKLFEDKIVM